MSRSLYALQENAEAASEAFCKRYVTLPRRRPRPRGKFSSSTSVTSFNNQSSTEKFYRPRNHEDSLFFKAVHWVYQSMDPLKCPTCGDTMKVVSFIEQEDVVRNILKHCNMWKEDSPRAPPVVDPPDNQA